MILTGFFGGGSLVFGRTMLSYLTLNYRCCYFGLFIYDDFNFWPYEGWSILNPRLQK